MPKLRNSIKWRISNPGCLDCDIVSKKERAKHLTHERDSLHHHQPVNNRLHSRKTVISTSHPLLCKPAEACASKWQEQWEKTDSNLKRYNIHPKERLPGGHTLPWRAWRTANRVHSGQTATSAAKHLWGYRASKICMCGAATCDLNHIMISCTHFGERPSVDDIAELKDGYVRWLIAVADSTSRGVMLFGEKAQRLLVIIVTYHFLAHF